MDTLKYGVLLALCVASLLTPGTNAQNRCLCGWFVDTMWPQLSNLDPLDLMSQTNVAIACNLQECQNYCGMQGNAIRGVNLNEIVGGKTRGQAYCEQVHALTGTGVNTEYLFVLSRVPDCETFFVWGTSKVYISSTTSLCCSGAGTYTPC